MYCYRQPTSTNYIVGLVGLKWGIGPSKKNVNENMINNHRMGVIPYLQTKNEGNAFPCFLYFINYTHSFAEFCSYTLNAYEQNSAKRCLKTIVMTCSEMKSTR